MSLHLPKHNWGTRGVDAYEKLECIGAGTYGCVVLAYRSVVTAARPLMTVVLPFVASRVLTVTLLSLHVYV